MSSISLTVNGKSVVAEVEPRRHLADFLREDLLLTGTHLGCEHGVCGACTVLVDDVPVRSCITFAAALDGSEVVTIEGMQNDPVVQELRSAFSREHALQCGFCTPGMIVIARDVAIRLNDATDREVRRELAGHICRCTGYVGIVRAVQSATKLDWAQYSKVRTQTDRSAKPLAANEQLSVSDAPLSPRPDSSPASSRQALSSDGFTRIEQRFDLPFSRQQVWDFFQDPAKVVTCLPGAALVEPSDGTTIKGRFTAKLGPMRASFTGEGTIVSDVGRWTGVIDGRATDQGSSTRGRGRLSYTLIEGAAAEQCVVEVGVEYALTGPLAQISRGGIARDLASRLTMEFAGNVRRSLSGESVVAKELSASALLSATLKSWIGKLWPFKRNA